MKRVLALVILALLVPGVAACGGTDEGGSGDGGGELEFLTFGDPEELEAYREMIAAFEKSQDGINVKLIEASDRDDLIARMSTSFSAGDPPDLFLINYRFYGQFAARGVLEPMAKYLADSDVFAEKDFYAPAMDAFRFGGQQTCMPQNISSLVVYYNRDLFEAAGLEEPATGWTWDEMVERAEKLTVDTDGDGEIDQYGLGVEPQVIRIAPFVWSNGGEVVDDEDQPTKFTLDSPEAVEALQAFIDLRSENGVIPTDEEREAEDDESRFVNGRTAMVMSSRRSTPTFRTITDFDWDVAAVPVHKEQAGILHSDAYCMAKDSPNKDAAWTFVEFALGPEGAPIVARSGRTVPSLIEVAESDAFLDPDAKPANSKVFLDTIPVIRRVPSVSTWPEIEDAAEGVLETAVFAGGDAAEVAADMDEATREIFARAEG